MEMVTFNQLNMKTKDGRYTQRQLINKINKIAQYKGCDSEAAQSAIRSFVTNGIVETYNELGYQEWIKMIDTIVSHEAAERRIQ